MASRFPARGIKVVASLNVRLLDTSVVFKALDLVLMSIRARRQWTALGRFLRSAGLPGSVCFLVTNDCRPVAPSKVYRREQVACAPAPDDSYLVDPASSHMLVSKIKPCMSKYKLLHSETANGSLDQLWFLRSYNPTWITVVILELIHESTLRLSWEERFYYNKTNRPSGRPVGDSE